MLTEQLIGFTLYGMSLLTMGAIYGLLALGLNLQWGITGIFNTGIGGFVAIGAYTSAILSTEPSVRHLGGFEQPLLVGIVAGMVLSGIIAWLIAKICMGLRSDYLAIATLGIAEILRLILKNEAWATNGPRGIGQVPKPFAQWGELWQPFLVMATFLAVLFIVYALLEKVRLAPWGRVMCAIRDNENAATALGKPVEKFRTEAFVVGAMLMSVGGSLMAHYLTYIGPNVTEPISMTFLIWVMVIVGGSGSYRGSMLGAFVIWTIWSATEIFTIQLPEDWAIRVAYIRVFLVGLLLQFMLQKFPSGLIGEKRLNSDEQKSS